jgi:regulator of sirC expression with transglutaminase-like and TPR domain
MAASPTAPKQVASLAQRGLNDFGRRDYANALVAFAEASRASNDPAMLFDTGLCYYMLHRPQEALQHLQLYVDRAPQAGNRAQADALIGDLHRQMGMDE